MPVATGQPAIAASELEEEDAIALQEMLAVMNRKPHEEGKQCVDWSIHSILLEGIPKKTS